MPIDRKLVEDYFKEEERKFNEVVGPVKTRVLEILSEDSEKLYTFEELAEKLALASSGCRKESCECSTCSGYLMPALKILSAEEKIVIYPWPIPETPETQFYFGVKKN